MEGQAFITRQRVMSGTDQHQDKPQGRKNGEGVGQISDDAALVVGGVLRGESTLGE
jgi:hypothetical protein